MAAAGLARLLRKPQPLSAKRAASRQGFALPAEVVAGRQNGTRLLPDEVGLC
ncbi:MAG: hypothetical protein K8R77_00955 [Anaerolineaceae bacterium]|nr:hypothetical protein [Anaerolineaceae bacterium]